MISSLKKWILVLGLASTVSISPALVALGQPSDLIVFQNSILPFRENVHVLGSADPNALIEFDIALKMRNFTKLRQRTEHQEILSSNELEQKHFPLQSDYSALKRWAKDHNLTVSRTHSDRLTIHLAGTVDLVSSALGIELMQVEVDDKQFIATETAPSLPKELAGFVLGINGLQPYLSFHTMSSIVPLSTTVPYTPPYSVSDIKRAYNADTNNLGTGAGQRIAILIDTLPLDSDLTAFWSANGIPQSLNNIEKVNVKGGTLPPLNFEETLDAEWASGIAPASKVRIYATTSLSETDIDNGYQSIINDLNSGVAINELSESFGICEALLTTSQKNTDDQFLTIIASRGVSIFVASGDNGSTNNCPIKQNPVGVSFPASDPNVTAVGGTSLRLSGSGAVTSEVVWNTNFTGANASGGGVSSFFARPTWQVGTGVIAGTTRLVPDVALDADPATGYYIFYNGQPTYIGGTSAGTPTWAGFAALINQSRAIAGIQPLGLANPFLYPKLLSSSFRDITVGTNGAYGAMVGYDLATGIGVPVVSALRAIPLLGSSVASTDVNGDGKADAIVVNSATNPAPGVYTKLSNGVAFGANQNWSNGVYNGDIGTYFGDVNGDGKADAIVVNSAKDPATGIYVKLSNGVTFGATQNWFNALYSGDRGNFFSDVNGDGKVDAIVVNSSADPAPGVYVKLSNGTTFGATQNWTNIAYVGDKGNAFADVNGDGKVDAIVNNSSGGATGITVRLSNGTTFLPNQNWTNFGAFFGTFGTYYADVDGDGKADAIASNSDGLFVKRSTGLSFGPTEQWTSIQFIGDNGATFFADVNGDGKADAVVNNSSGGAIGITVRLSNGTTFLPNQNWTNFSPFVGDLGTYIQGPR